MKQILRKTMRTYGIIILLKILIKINPKILIIINNKYMTGINITIDKS